MDDLSICKRIAEIEGVEVVSSKTYDIQRIAELKPYYKSKVYDDVSRNIAIEAEYFKHNEYNPLTDDGLCFRLMIEHEMTIGFTECPAGTGRAYFATGNHKTTRNNVCSKYCGTPNEALCLAVIAANEG